MEKRKEYRSAIRSRRLIRCAFLELLREKPCEKITVTDIVTRADINRSTFYAHYPDVRGLVEEIVGEAITYSTELADSLNIKEFLEDPMPFLRDLTSYGSGNKELYALLCRSDFAQRQMEHLKRTLIDSALRSPAFPDELRCSPEFRIHISFFRGRDPFAVYHVAPGRAGLFCGGHHQPAVQADPMHRAPVPRA